MLVWLPQRAKQWRKELYSERFRLNSLLSAPVETWLGVQLGLCSAGGMGGQTTKLFSNAYQVAKTALDACEGQPHSTPAVYPVKQDGRVGRENAEQQFWPGALFRGFIWLVRFSA